MKVTIDGILNTARQMKGQTKVEEEPSRKKKTQKNQDSIEIRQKINSRLITIQKELNDVQSSLTKNQIIREGINLLIEDSNKNGGSKQDLILKEFKFENQAILANFLKGDLDRENLKTKRLEAMGLAEDDSSKLKRLQIEAENIIASNLINSEAKDVIKEIEAVISKTDAGSLAKISELKPETVMNLIN